jgi:hypothetical protein
LSSLDLSENAALYAGGAAAALFTTGVAVYIANQENEDNLSDESEKISSKTSAPISQTPPPQGNVPDVTTKKIEGQLKSTDNKVADSYQNDTTQSIAPKSYTDSMPDKSNSPISGTGIGSYLDDVGSSPQSVPSLQVLPAPPTPPEMISTQSIPSSTEKKELTREEKERLAEMKVEKAVEKISEQLAEAAAETSAEESSQADAENYKYY